MPDSIQHQKDDAFRNAAGRRRAFPAFLILGLLCVGLALVYVFQGMTPETWDFNMARRIPIVIALVLVGTAVGLSSVVFQTITTNYILTPSVMGLDNLYVLLQTLVLYFVGSTQLTTMQSPLCFMGALLLMVCVSTGIFFYMFRGQNGGNIYFVVLVGMIFGITFGGLSNFMQVLIDPSEFAILEGRLFASFNRINEELLFTAGLVIAATVIWLVCDLRKLDVLTLGRSTAITLGVNYNGWCCAPDDRLYSGLGLDGARRAGDFPGHSHREHCPLHIPDLPPHCPHARHGSRGRSCIDFRHAAYRTVAQLLRAPERNHQFRWRGLLYLPDHEN